MIREKNVCINPPAGLEEWVNESRFVYISWNKWMWTKIIHKIMQFRSPILPKSNWEKKVVKSISHDKFPAYILPLNCPRINFEFLGQSHYWSNGKPIHVYLYTLRHKYVQIDVFCIYLNLVFNFNSKGLLSSHHVYYLIGNCLLAYSSIYLRATKDVDRSSVSPIKDYKYSSANLVKRIYSPCPNLN